MHRVSHDLKLELHQTRVEGNRHQEVCRDDHSQWEARNEGVDAPELRRELCKDDHHDRDEHAVDQRSSEIPQNSRNFNEEVGLLCFFASGAPCHLDGEHVRDQSLTDVH